MPRLIRACRIQWWCSLFSFLARNFGEIGSKKSKLSVWYLGYSEYAEFSGDVHFFHFQLEVLFLGKFCPKNQNSQFKLKFVT